jgi:hypothetical protein
LIAVDVVKNRIYLKIKGDWMEKRQVTAFTKDAVAAVNECCPGLTILADNTEIGMQAFPDLHEQAMKTAMERGIKKVAEVFSKESFAKLTLERAAERTGLPTKWFDSFEAGEAWLDQG